MWNDIDLLNLPAEPEKRRLKLERLVQSPNSFMDVNCQGCFNITTVFSHRRAGVRGSPRDVPPGGRETGDGLCFILFPDAGNVFSYDETMRST